MFRLILVLFAVLVRLFHTHRSLHIENLTLCQQLTVLERRHPSARLSLMDRLFWTAARGFWPGWEERLIIVTPETVARWHRTAFQMYWRWLSQFKGRGGRKRISKGVRDLIFCMVAENRTWGAPRIHRELLMLGFDVSERTIYRWMCRAPRDPEPAKLWLTFLRNHGEAIAAMDFFTVPTITFGMVYCFFIIRHDRRCILHFNVTPHPTSQWMVQQLREAFPFESAPTHLLLDRDRKYGLEVTAAIRSMAMHPVRTSFQSPWQNGIAERWVETADMTYWPM
jgi:putative transposase